MEPGLPHLRSAAMSGSLGQSSETMAPWCEALPELRGSMSTLRALDLNDAPALLTMLATPEVARFIPPPPTTIDGFERFIVHGTHEQAAGRSVCFAVVPRGVLSAAGVFQIRGIDSGFGSAEWGFALGSSYWGSGLFLDSARQVVDFAFDVLRLHRLEARAAVPNGRGNGALRKLGAVREGLLRSALCRGDRQFDQVLWTILDRDWQAAHRRRSLDAGASSNHA
ncbi:MAG: GNAT family N-acetyltransferase [Acidobacteriota bacterium]|nr:GNAT family N-acetyltransferase [Acidobacteriota bacterium]